MKRLHIATLLATAALMAAPSAFAADHLDGPGVSMDPASDITDVYTFLDGNSVVFVLDVSPLAMAPSGGMPGSQFSDKVQYVLHTTSGAGFGMKTDKVDIIATFDTAQTIKLWLGTADYVTGDAGAVGGISSASGKVKVFAGLRDDPFFFNLQGFKNAVAFVDMAAPSLTFNGSGCPEVGMAAAVVAGLLKTNDDMGGAPVNFFAGKNVLSIVVSVDKSLVTTGGSVVSVWGSTHTSP
jgi:hypothetical protein